VDSLGGEGIEAFEGVFAGAVFVMVALDAGNVHGADDVQALLGAGIVADHVTQAYNLVDLLFADVREDHLEGIQIPVNICNNGVFHWLTDYLKPAKLVGCISPQYLLVPNKSSQTCFPQRLAVSFQFRAVALENQFHSAIGEIADGADDFKTGGHGAGGIAETDPLDMP